MLDDILHRSPIPFLVAGEWQDSSSRISPHRLDSFTKKLPGFPGERPAWTVARPGTEDVLRAADSVSVGQRILSSLPRHRLREILDRTATLLADHRNLLAGLICAEVGKPISAALSEVDRAITTFRVAASCTETDGFASLPGEIVPQGTGMLGLVDRVSNGPVLAITPYNFPLNLLAHKVAPAIATGSALIVKPAPLGMTVAIALGALLLEAGLPPEALSVLPCDLPDAERLISHPALPVISFTGSALVGWNIRDRVPRKKVLLELGGSAAVMVWEDGWSTDLLDRLLAGAYAYAGQVCISIQRILVARPLYERVRDGLVEKIRGLDAEGRIGDLSSPRTLMGPLIRQSHADNVRKKVEEAVGRGGRLLLPLRQEGTLLYPTLLAETSAEWPIEQEEIFGPVATINSFETPEEAIARINHSRYGIQAGIFSRSIDRAIGWARKIEAGGVLINEIPTFRLDHWPYGGIKESGLGFEGVRYAMEEMTRPRLLAIRIPLS